VVLQEKVPQQGKKTKRPSCKKPAGAPGRRTMARATWGPGEDQLLKSLLEEARHVRWKEIVSGSVGGPRSYHPSRGYPAH
jgi:hypothetical protein